MSNSHVAYDRTKPFGQLTAEMIEHMVQARATAARIQALLVQLGALGGNGAVIEGDPLFNVAVGQGNAFVTAIGYMTDGMRGAVPLAQDQIANLDFGG